MEGRVGLLRMTTRLTAATQTKDSWFSVLFAIPVLSSLLVGIVSTSWTMTLFHLSLFILLVFYMCPATSMSLKLLRSIHLTLRVSEVKPVHESPLGPAAESQRCVEFGFV